MNPCKRLWAALSAVGVGVTLEGVAFAYGLFGGAATVPPGPESLSEVARVAHEVGLYSRSEQKDGALFSRIVVSDRPIYWPRPNNLRFNAPHHPCWTGTVAVCFPWQRFMANYDPECSAIWGSMFVYGDPALIRRLTGRSD